MSPPGLGFLRERRAAGEFERLDPSFRELVFYSEGPGDWPHLGPVVLSLLREHGQKVSYLTSDPRDPGLHVQDEGFRAFMIGSGTARTVLFRKIACRRFVMTLPDLDQLWLRRSVHPVEYVYIFHSTNSTHTVYRKGAFDAYDTILCVGPYQVDEIRRTEAHYGLQPKELVEAGSIKLESVLAEFEALPHARPAGDPPEVLLAPSWGEGSLIEAPIGEEVLQALLGAGFRTVLRLHPMTVRRLPKLVAHLRASFGSQRLFRLEEDMSATDSWLHSDLMISDWSGAATEYAFALQKPVVYIDTPQKIRNPEWEAIGLPAFEDFIRREIGQVVQPSAVSALPDVVRQALDQTDASRQRILAARSKWIYKVGHAVVATAEGVAVLEEPGAQHPLARR